MAHPRGSPSPLMKQSGKITTPNFSNVPDRSCPSDGCDSPSSVRAKTRLHSFGYPSGGIGVKSGSSSKYYPAAGTAGPILTSFKSGSDPEVHDRNIIHPVAPEPADRGLHVDTTSRDGIQDSDPCIPPDYDYVEKSIASGSQRSTFSFQSVCSSVSKKSGYASVGSHSPGSQYSKSSGGSGSSGFVDSASSVLSQYSGYSNASGYGSVRSRDADVPSESPEHRSRSDTPVSHSSEDSGPGGTEDLDPELLNVNKTDAVITECGSKVNTENNVGLMDLFGVQLEVTHRLLKAEKKKLCVLQKELETELTAEHIGHRKATEVEQLRVNIRRIQQQYDQLEVEYDNAAKGLLKTSNKLRKSARSQPAMGMKQAEKPRPTIFGTVTIEKLTSEGSHRRSLGFPQMHSGLHSKVVMATSSPGIQNGIGNHVGDVKEALVYQDGNLAAGSLDALIQHLVPTDQYKPERTYVFAFLLSSRLFIKPHQLFNQVCQTCMYQQNLMSEGVSRESLGMFGPHFIQLLGEWTDNFPYDFRDERMMRCLKDITQRIVIIYPELRKDVGLLMHNLFSKLSGLQKYEELLTRINAEVAQRLLNIMPTTDIYEVSPSPLVLAQQLTHIELERLSMIGPEEFVQAFAKEDKEQVPSAFKDLKKTNNLESYVQWFNRLSYFVATEICMHLKKKNRVRLIEYFIDVAKECINIGNFNSLMAIIAGLNMNPIQRLKKTWERVNKEKFEILEHQMNPSSNFGSYRSSLKAALWRCEGAMEDREKIVIPFFSLFVKDMYFLNEGCCNRVGDGQVNFGKFWQLAKQISEFITWKQIECPFDRHPPVLNYLLTNPVFSENSLSLASFECEAPDNSYEKQRYKSLKEQAGL